MLSSTWLQKRRKYCAADTRALITTSQSRKSASGFREGCLAPAMRTATAQTCNTILVLPRVEAAIVKPSAEAMFRRPRTVNSRPMMITTRPIRSRRQQQDQHSPDLEMHGDAPKRDVGATGQQNHDEDGNKKNPQQSQ